MIIFDYKEIRVVINASISTVSYQDRFSRERSFQKRKVSIDVVFMEFELSKNDLTELYFVKAAVEVFLQSYWRNTSKKGLSKINLDKTLINRMEGDRLQFVARQHQKQHFLEISYRCYGEEETHKVYLDYHEAIMLNQALQKAINMSTPEQSIEAEEPRHSEVRQTAYSRF